MNALPGFKIEMDPDLCDLCGTCTGVCPADAIVLYEYRIRVLEARCTGCRACVDVCPAGAAREAA